MPLTPSLDAGAVLWSAAAAERAGRPLLVLLHGYGADERDLFGLAQFLPPEFVVAAVRAPLAPPWPAPGHSWYPIEGLESRDPAHVTDAASRLLEWLDASAPDVPVGLLGFSQGAAVAHPGDAAPTRAVLVRREPERLRHPRRAAGRCRAR